MKKVAIIIVTYNGEKLIEKCLKTVLNSTYVADIFVADNASTDSTLSILNKYKNNISIRKLTFNSGFGFANNILLKETLKRDYEYFFLINQDVYCKPNTLENLISFSTYHPEFGIIAPIQFDGNGSEIDSNFKQYIKLSKEKESFYETNFCNAAAWLISKKCIEKVGIFNELFKHYGEDRNYCDRVKFHGFKIAILKSTEVLHDREQKMTPEKALKMAKIKMLTIFLNPNFSKSKSLGTAFYNVFGLGKYILKKYKKPAFKDLFKEFQTLFKRRNYLELEKNKNKSDYTI